MFGYPQTSYYSPFAAQRASYNADELARARYLRALQEQRAARQAYADAVAEREVRRLEQQQHMRPRGHPYLTGDAPSDEDEDMYEYDPFGRPYIRDPYALARARQQQRRQEALEAELARSRARAQVQAEAEERYRQDLLQRLSRVDADSDQQLPPQQSYRKLGRVTPTPGHSPQPTNSKPEETSPTRVEIRTAQDSPSTTEPSATSASATEEPPVQSPALSAITAITDAAAKLRQTFSMPQDLDFVVDSSNPASHKLSYASSNLPVRAYEHELSKLLEQLDGVESRGINEIREARRSAVKAIELALEELEGRVEGEWNKRHGSPSASGRGEVAVAVDDSAEESSAEQTVTMDETDADVLATEDVPATEDAPATEDVPATEDAPATEDVPATEEDVPMLTDADREDEDTIAAPVELTEEPTATAASELDSKSVPAVLATPAPEPAVPTPDQPSTGPSSTLGDGAAQLDDQKSSERADDSDFDIVDRPEL